VQVGRVGSSTDLIVQHIEYVSQEEKKNTLLDLISTVEVSRVEGWCVWGLSRVVGEGRVPSSSQWKPAGYQQWEMWACHDGFRQ
jgi:hypothetical protein